MVPPATSDGAKPNFSDPEEVLNRFYDSILGHTRNWPRAYECLSPLARERFEIERGLQSFADYWDDKLTFLEELVESRHREFPYTHRTCFWLNRVERQESDGERAVFRVELLENHAAPERMLVAQVKAVENCSGKWMLADGTFEGDMDDVITVKSWRAHRASGYTSAGETAE